MRAKVVIPLLLLGFGALLLPFIVRPKPPVAEGQAAAATAAISQPAPPATLTHHPEIPSHHLTEPARENVAESNVIAGDTEEEKNENYVSDRITELGNLGMTDDPYSLVTIESEFESREPRIQEAAVAAAIQFGSRDAIPALQNAYLRSDDPAQKLNIQKAMDFLALPSMSEVSNGIVSSAIASRQP